MKMWRPNREIDFIDLGHDYFILKLTDLMERITKELLL
jgi:hypothetical protein